MSLQTRAEVEIEVVAKGDQAVQTNRRTVDSINRDYKSLRQEQLAVRHEFELNNRSLVATQRVLSGVGRVAGTLTTMWTKYNIAQIRVADADRNAMEATAEYLRTLAEFGPAAQQTQDALRQQTEALEDQQRAANDARLMYVFLGIESAQAIGGMIGAIPKLKELATTLRGVAAANTLTGAASVGGAVLPGMAGTAGKTGGLLGKIGGMKGIGAIGGGALVAGGVLSSSAITGDKDNTTRLLSLAQSAGGGALLGLSLGGPIGALIGGVGGLGLGLATNYGEEFSNLFSGKGFVSNQDANKVQINSYTFQGYDMDDAQRIIAQSQETGEVYGN